MSAKDLFYAKDHSYSNQEERMFAREELAYDVSEDLLIILEDLGVSKAELARRLSKSKAYVTQILSGSRNMNLGSLSDICFAIGIKPVIKLPVQEKVTSHNWHNENDAPSKNIDIIIGTTENIIDRREQKIWTCAA